MHYQDDLNGENLDGLGGGKKAATTALKGGSFTVSPGLGRKGRLIAPYPGQPNTL